MKRRLLFLGLVIAAVLLAFSQADPDIDVVPFPVLVSTRVRLKLPVRQAGDYRVEVSMPKIDNKNVLEEERHPCSFLFTVEDGGKQILSRHADSIVAASEYGWANTQTFVAGDNFHLGYGNYDVTITGGGACPVAATRGASITVCRFEREHILGSLLVNFLTVLLLFIGVVGLLFSEFIRRPNKRIQPTQNSGEPLGVRSQQLTKL